MHAIFVRIFGKKRYPLIQHLVASPSWFGDKCFLPQYHPLPPPLIMICVIT